MDEMTLESFRKELKRINNKITNEIENRDIREIQRDELKLLKKILQKLKKEELSNDQFWEKSNIFNSISFLHYNIHSYPTLLGLRSPLIMIEKAICDKGILTPDQRKEAEIFKIDSMISDIDKLIDLVN